MSVSIRCWPALTGQRIPPSLHGLSIAHRGRCIYDGIQVGEGASIPNRKGIRLDLLAAFTHLRIPLISWPGSDFCQEYHWKQGMCKKERRKLTTNASAQQLEPHTFGTEGFLLFCQKLGTTPCLQVNTHTGSPQEARDWVEYCTFPGSSTLAELRAQAGSPRPHEIPFWDLAAPAFNSSSSWAPIYAEKYAAFASAMKAIAPDLQLWAGPGRPLQDLPKSWVADFIESIPPALLPHALTAPYVLKMPLSEHTDEAAYYESYGQIHELEKQLNALQGLLNYHLPEQDLSVVVNDWMISKDQHSEGKEQEPRQTLQAALLGASFFHSLHRLAPFVSAALFGPAINAEQCLAVTEEERIYLTPLYHVFDMMRPHREGRLVTTKSTSPYFPDDLATPASPLLDSCATLTRKKLYLTVINRSQTEILEGSVDIADASITSVSGRVLKGSRLTDANNMDAPSKISAKRIRPQMTEGQLQYAFAPLSVTALSFSLTTP